MPDLVIRSPKNPLLSPKDLTPSHSKMIIEGLLNPGVFSFKEKIGLVVRVAERTIQKDGYISIPQYTDAGKIKILHFKLDDPKLQATDARVIKYDGNDYLTTVSHLRILFSVDGLNFNEDPNFPPIFGKGAYETYGIEDCRVSKIQELYYLTYTMVSDKGVGVGLQTTKDWKQFERKGMILSPHNKDCALFEETINGNYYALHRPSSPELGGNYIWLAESSDGVHWGNHKCLAKTRKGKFDSKRVGAGAAPIKTDMGWLQIYHGADDNQCYSLGLLLLDLEDPTKVIARSEHPFMEPFASYELTGFFGNVVFTNGHLVTDDDINVYYGASDQYICLAKTTITDLLSSLRF